MNIATSAISSEEYLQDIDAYKWNDHFINSVFSVPSVANIF